MGTVKAEKNIDEAIKEARKIIKAQKKEALKKQKTERQKAVEESLKRFLDRQKENEA